jgi:zeaxanthin glucosyltransferase
MKIAFLGVRVPGHLNPMTTLARKLKGRGHDVLFISVPDTEPFVRAAQLPFVPFCEQDFPIGSLEKSLAQLNKLQGQAALELVKRLVAKNLESAFRNLPQTLQEAKVDGLVLDETERGLGCVPLHRTCPTFMFRTPFTLIFQAIHPYVHLTGNMRQPRRHWQEIRQVCVVC